MTRYGTTYTGHDRRMVALPLGGIGTGNVALSGTGVLKQWQLHHQGNHLGFVPQTFFGLRLSSLEPPLSFHRVLQAPAVPVHPEPAPMVNDDLDAAGDYARPFAWPKVTGTRFTGAYPYATVDYEDDWPVDVQLEAVTPFVPLDADASGLPLVHFTFRVTNRFSHDLHGWLLGSLQNVVGWDGVTPIRDAQCAVLGGNVNTVAAVSGGQAVLMASEGIATDHPGWGTMALWAAGPSVSMVQFDDVDAALAMVDSLKLLTPVVLEDWSDKAVAQAVAALRPTQSSVSRPSAPGRTWAGALAQPVHVRPGETVSVEVVIAWHFPNRRADFDRFGDSDNADAEPVLVGNHYTQGFSDAEAVITHFAGERESLLGATRAWADALYGSTLPPVVIDVLGAQPSLIRSPTTFRTADGRFFGFEGVLGESTLNWNGNIGGSCPLNCTHVWNYEQAVSRLFPELERSMRETDWDVLQAPEGYLPHRVLMPIDGPQLHGRPVGGPTRPALDGMLGTVLKTYREVRQGAGEQWLARYLPHARRLMDYVERTWDPDGSGVLTGDQPVTHDISLQGPNMYVGGIWLAALRAMQEMTTEAEAQRYGEAFRRASKHYDELLWNGEYYGQRSEGEAFDFGSGCLSDQLFGQWWAHQLDLGHLLPPAHVTATLRAIVRYNLRPSFRGFEHGYRIFADGDDRGLLICTWPHGGRPEVPIRYADEVWTGVEYQVAAHCLYEGLTAEGLDLLAAVRGRYDGSRRNPYNEIECGDHYSRAMAGWSVLEACTGFSYDAVHDGVRLGRGVARYPFLAGTGWGEVVNEPGRIRLRCLGGVIAVATVRIPGFEVVNSSLDGTAVLGTVTLSQGHELVVTIRRARSSVDADPPPGR